MKAKSLTEFKAMTFPPMPCDVILRTVNAVYGQ